MSDPVAHPRRCQPWQVTCERRAAWLFVKTCCDMEFFFCDKHRADIQADLNYAEHRGEMFVCDLCSANDLPATFGVWTEL
jgi:hypothetical protein